MIGRWQGSKIRAMLGIRRGVNLAKERQFTGIVLYSGEQTLRFGEGFYAVPLAALGA